MNFNMDKVVEGIMYTAVVGGGLAVSEIKQIPLTTLTPSLLLGIGILLMFTGKLHHVSALDRERAISDKFEKAYLNESEARATSDKQVSELLEYAKATDLFIKSQAKESKQGGD